MINELYQIQDRPISGPVRTAAVIKPVKERILRNPSCHGQREEVSKRIKDDLELKAYFRCKAHSHQLCDCRKLTFEDELVVKVACYQSHENISLLANTRNKQND